MLIIIITGHCGPWARRWKSCYHSGVIAKRKSILSWYDDDGVKITQDARDGGGEGLLLLACLRNFPAPQNV